MSGCAWEGGFEFYVHFSLWPSWCSLLMTHFAAAVVTLLSLNQSSTQPIPCYLHAPNCEFQTTQRAFPDCNQNCLWEIMHLKKLLYYAVISILFKNLCFLELISQKAIELSIKHFWEINTRWIHVVQIRTSHYICNGYLRRPKVIEHGNCAAVSEGFYWHLFCLCFAWAHNCRNIPPWWLVPNLK